MKRKKFAQDISDILSDDLEMLERLEPGAILRPELPPRPSTEESGEAPVVAGPESAVAPSEPVTSHLPAPDSEPAPMSEAAIAPRALEEGEGAEPLAAGGVPEPDADETSNVAEVPVAEADDDLEPSTAPGALDPAESPLEEPELPGMPDAPPAAEPELFTAPLEPEADVFLSTADVDTPPTEEAAHGPQTAEPFLGMDAAVEAQPGGLAPAPVEPEEVEASSTEHPMPGDPAVATMMPEPPVTDAPAVEPPIAELEPATRVGPAEGELQVDQGSLAEAPVSVAPISEAEPIPDVEPASAAALPEAQPREEAVTADPEATDRPLAPESPAPIASEQSPPTEPMSETAAEAPPDAPGDVPPAQDVPPAEDAAPGEAGLGEAAFTAGVAEEPAALEPVAETPLVSESSVAAAEPAVESATSGLEPEAVVSETVVESRSEALPGEPAVEGVPAPGGPTDGPSEQVAVEPAPAAAPPDATEPEAAASEPERGLEALPVPEMELPIPEPPPIPEPMPAPEPVPSPGPSPLPEPALESGHPTSEPEPYIRAAIPPFAPAPPREEEVAASAAPPEEVPPPEPAPLGRRPDSPIPDRRYAEITEELAAMAGQPRGETSTARRQLFSDAVTLLEIAPEQAGGVRERRLPGDRAQSPPSPLPGRRTGWGHPVLRWTAYITFTLGLAAVLVWIMIDVFHLG